VLKCSIRTFDEVNDADTMLLLTLNTGSVHDGKNLTIRGEYCPALV